jgi:hypothetical protein
MKKYIPILVGLFVLMPLAGRVSAVAVTPPEDQQETTLTKNSNNTVPVPASSEAATADGVRNGEPTPTPAPEYVLPYPGVMPDNPLYFLKTLRDNIMEWLITDPVRKIDYYILQSDKQLNAGIMLGLANKKALVPKVLNESLLAMKKAVTMASISTNLTREMKLGAADKIERSLGKHEQVLGELLDKATETEKGVFQPLLTTLAGYKEEVKKLR